MGMKRNKTIECRSIQIRASNDGDENLHVEGYATVFGERTLLWDSPYSGTKYYEVIEPGAIDENTDMGDVILRYNHSDAALILARTSNDTLRLNVDDKGIHVDADIAPTSNGKDIYQLIKRGDLSKMSFAFTVDQQSFDEDNVAKEETRHIKHIDYIMDVSPVDFPAYDGTSISARGRKEMIAELEKREKEKELREKLITESYL